jgi:hypothetical protein
VNSTAFWIRSKAFEKVNQLPDFVRADSLAVGLHVGGGASGNIVTADHDLFAFSRSRENTGTDSGRIGFMDRQFIADFRHTVDSAASRLLIYSDEEASRAPASGKWCRKEILGHLIDSAANNHVRFVRAQASDDLVFDGYDQDAWVRLQRYQERDWADLVTLWQAYNHHVASVMNAADAAALTRPRARHSLERIAFETLPADQPATLEYLMRDYVVHLKHHLRQALG